jgi:hypothetical protein
MHLRPSLGSTKKNVLSRGFSVSDILRVTKPFVDFHEIRYRNTSQNLLKKNELHENRFSCTLLSVQRNYCPYFHVKSPMRTKFTALNLHIIPFALMSENRLSEVHFPHTEVKKFLNLLSIFTDGFSEDISTVRFWNCKFTENLYSEIHCLNK